MKKPVLITLFLMLTTTISLAQDWNWQVGPNLSFAFRNKDYANVNALGEGLGAKIIYNWQWRSWISPRLDFVYLSFGEKRSTTTGGGASGLIIQTRNESFQLTTGLHFAKPDGAVRYYLSPMAGVYNFRAVTTLPELYYYYGYPSMDTHDIQWKMGARVQGGFLFDIGLGPLIDIGFTYQRIFNVETKIDDTVLHHDADDFMVTIGVMIFSK